MNMNVSKEMISRLSNYRRVLYKLKTLGFDKVFSDNLADALRITSAQVRKDFSQFNLTGNKKGGYKVSLLIEGINDILDKDNIKKVIVVGCGRMGKTLMNYHGFSEEGIRIVAGFDSDPATIEPNTRIPILDILDMPNFVKKEKVDIAILSVPEHVASILMEKLKTAGIRGVLNFAPLQMHSTETCEVRNINIALELENMFYFINHINLNQ